MFKKFRFVKVILKSSLTLVVVSATMLVQAQIGIGTTTPQAILDVASTTSGLLIPRMTTVQRNAIPSPPNGLQVYNISSNTTDIYRNGQWQSVAYASLSANLVYVNSLSDLPAPSGSSITLDANKMYIFSGFVNISPYYLNLNGAGLRGTDPGKDGVMSTISGGVLRSSNVSVFIENLAVLPASAGTKAYDFADATGTMFCNLFSGCSVVEIGIPSLGVGQVSGFNAITIAYNYWNCKDGIKVTGNVGKFASAYNFITGISSGCGIEFLSGLTINDIDLSNNYFIYTGQTGIKVNAGATINRGRMTTNMYRGVTTYISGFDSYTPAWDMRQNTYVPNSRAFSSVYMNTNTTLTSLPVVSTYYKVAGTTTSVSQKRFTASNNRLTYAGKDTITAKVLVIIGAYAPNDLSSFSIAIAKNGIIISTPNGTMAPTSNNQSFQITLATELDMGTNDYIEVFIKSNNSNSSSIKVDDLQFRVTD